MNKQQAHQVRVAMDSVKRLANTIEYVQDENDKLRKALDKACEELASLDYENWMRQYPFVHDYDHKDAVQWKEVLMEDD